MRLYSCEQCLSEQYFMYIDAFMWKCSVCRSSDDQEVLFDQILMGQLEFPLPYWDNVSETAKVNISVCTDIVCVL